MSTIEKIGSGIVILCIIILAFALVEDARAAECEWDNGLILEVPEESWKLEAKPIGFNTAPYHYELNLKGKTEGPWGTWPFYETLCPTPDFSPRDPACIRPTVVEWPHTVNVEPKFDFYDTNRDGIVDFGPVKGCSYDIFTYPEGGFDCPQ